jgi:aminoglycoside phosphotransferase (APT) family kinase protein
MRWGQRPDWDAVPATVRAGIEAMLGRSVVVAETPPGGHSPILAALLTLADGSRVFVKSVSDGWNLAATNRTEAAVTAALPDGAPAPALLTCGETAGWFTAVYTAVDGRHPDISPASSELPAVLDAFAAVTELPISPRLGTHLRGRAATVLAEYLHGWQHLAGDPPADLDPWAAARLSMLTSLERDRARAIDGRALGHSDARPDNMLIHNGEVTLVDWAHSLIGAPWLDAAFLVPLLIVEGWRPADAKAAVGNHPLVAATAAEHDLTTFWVALTGYWQRSSRLPAPEGSPGLRPYQRAAAAAGVELLQLCLD